VVNRGPRRHAVWPRASTEAAAAAHCLTPHP
jgi:hypothetical protein